MDINMKFLEALKASLAGATVQWKESLEPAQWDELFKLAELHSVVPLFYEAVYQSPSYKAQGTDLDGLYKTMVRNAVILQTVKTSEFLGLYRKLLADSIKAVVVKGIICRNIYPMPDHRTSNDEDIYVSEEYLSRCHRVMLEYGLEAMEEDMSNNELCYIDKKTGVYIEVHKSLFQEDSEAYGQLNEFFLDSFDNTITENIEGVEVYTLDYTEHLLYLILHALKHFMHSGFGIRQLCDMVVYANTYGNKINWDKLLVNCKKINAAIFAASLFDLGEKYLCFSTEKACYPKQWSGMTIDSQELLLDLIDSGIYGQSTMSRLHSSNITLNAIASDKKGKKASFSVIKTIFPGKKSLVERYPYLIKWPLLLPIAWADRIIKYKKETNKRGAENSAAESMRVGNERIELMRRYGVLK